MLTHNGTRMIETERLILRRFEYTDDESMLEYWIADPAIQSMIPNQYLLRSKKVRTA